MYARQIYLPVEHPELENIKETLYRPDTTHLRKPFNQFQYEGLPMFPRSSRGQAEDYRTDLPLPIYFAGSDDDDEPEGLMYSRQSTIRRFPRDLPESAAEFQALPSACEYSTPEDVTTPFPFGKVNYPFGNRNLRSIIRAEYKAIGGTDFAEYAPEVVAEEQPNLIDFSPPSPKVQKVVQFEKPEAVEFRISTAASSTAPVPIDPALSSPISETEEVPCDTVVISTQTAPPTLDMSAIFKDVCAPEHTVITMLRSFLRGMDQTSGVFQAEAYHPFRCEDSVTLANFSAPRAPRGGSLVETRYLPTIRPPPAVMPPPQENQNRDEFWGLRRSPEGSSEEDDEPLAALATQEFDGGVRYAALAARAQERGWGHIPPHSVERSQLLSDDIEDYDDDALLFGQEY